jgi:hypothetical protein
MRNLIVLLCVGAPLFGQDPALTRLKHEMAVAGEQAEQAEQDKNFGKGGAARIASVHAALRDWIEPQLPKDVYSLAGEVSRLEVSLQKELERAGLSGADSSDPDVFIDPGFDEVGFEFKMMPELPDTLFVIATVKVPCGGDQAVYAYRFDSNSRTRVIDDHPKSDLGFEGANLELSDPDLQGRRLLLIHRMSTQCASTWMGMTYAVYRMDLSRPPESLLSSEHGFWLGNDGPAFVLKSDELMIEFLDRSVDMGIHNRTHIFRYSFANGVRRIEPVALQPQDFAEEWLTAPWSEMQSMSAPETAEWHRKLIKLSFDRYVDVVPCVSKPGRWAIGFQVTFEGEKELEEPIQNYFLVRDLGNYRYAMEAVSDEEFEGCPGEGYPSDKHPWLSGEQLKSLP